MAYTYTNEVPPRHHRFDTVMIHRNMSTWKRSKLRGKVLLITLTLDGINTLWIQLRLLNLVVLLVDAESIKLYTWFPYNQKYCRGEPPLLHKDTWYNGSFIKKSNLFPQKISRDLKSCPLVTSKMKCEPFVIEKGSNFYGMEPELVRIMLRSINAKEVMYPLPKLPQWYYISRLSNGSYSGAYWLLHERKVDLAGGCFMTGYEIIEVSDSLPSHMGDYFTWFFPGPIPISLAYGFATCLKNDIWIATGISFLAVYLFLMLIDPSSQSSSFVWILAIFTGLPYEIRIPKLLKIFGLLLEFMLLILTSLYRSSLLITLFDAPMDIYQSPEDGVDRGLVTILRQTFIYLYNTTNHELWNRIFEPGRFEMTFHVPVEKITEKRTHMTVAPHSLLTAFIKKVYPNRAFEELVTVLHKNYFHRTNMAIFMPMNHPLMEMLKNRMTRIIESGIPTYLLSLNLNSLHGRTGIKDSTKKPLGLKHLITLFYIMMGFLLVSLFIFLCEVVFYHFGRARKTGNKKLLRNNEVIRSKFGHILKTVDL